MTTRPGNSILEVLIGISIAGLIIVSVGNLVSSVNHTEQAAANKTQAIAYARESLELTTAIAQAEFQCPTSCTCTPPNGYTSCLEACPVNAPGCAVNTVYHPALTGKTWHLETGQETLGTQPVFTRSLTLTSVSGNTNLKNVTATVTWLERDLTRTVTASTILSGWKN